MKKNKHPEYRDVLFIDSSNGTEFIIGSTVETTETATVEGKEYPVYRVSVSSSSHPFFTKTKKYTDTEGRVGRFTNRYKNYTKKQESVVEEQKKDKERKAAPKKKKKS